MPGDARPFVVLVEADLAGEDAVEITLAVGIGTLNGEHGVVERKPEHALSSVTSGAKVLD